MFAFTSRAKSAAGFRVPRLIGSAPKPRHTGPLWALFAYTYGNIITDSWCGLPNELTRVYGQSAIPIYSPANSVVLSRRPVSILIHQTDRAGQIGNGAEGAIISFIDAPYRCFLHLRRYCPGIRQPQAILQYSHRLYLYRYK